MSFVRKDKRYLEAEDEMLERLDRKNEILDFYEEIWPLVKKAAKFGNIEEMLKTYSPMAVLTLAHQMVHGKSEQLRNKAAVDLMHMAEGKPVQRSISVTKNLDKFKESEVDAMIRGLLRKGKQSKRDLPAEKTKEEIVVEALPPADLVKASKG